MNSGLINITQFLKSAAHVIGSQGLGRPVEKGFIEIDVFIDNNNLLNPQQQNGVKDFVELDNVNINEENDDELQQHQNNEELQQHQNNEELPQHQNNEELPDLNVNNNFRANENTCAVCLVERPVKVILPCFHFGLCNQCADSINNRCPVCRAEITDLRTIYFAR